MTHNPVPSTDRCAARHPWPEAGAPVLEVRSLIRDLGSTVKTRVLHGIDLCIREGELVSLTGQSGSGKSTLLYLLGVLDRPTSGQVILDGEDASALDDDQRARLRNDKLGFVFQFHFLLPEFTVLENVMIPMLRKGLRSHVDAEEKARDVLTTLGLGELERRRPHQLSGGQQQRVEHRPCGGQRSEDCPGRRADGQSRLREWAHCDGCLRAARPRAEADGCRGDARAKLRRAGVAAGDAQRRARRRGHRPAQHVDHCTERLTDIEAKESSRAVGERRGSSFGGARWWFRARSWNGNESKEHADE